MAGLVGDGLDGMGWDEMGWDEMAWHGVAWHGKGMPVQWEWMVEPEKDGSALASLPSLGR